MQTIKSKQTLISQNNYPKLKTLVNFTWVGGLMAGILYISGLLIDMLITKQIFDQTTMLFILPIFAVASGIGSILAFIVAIILVWLQFSLNSWVSYLVLFLLGFTIVLPVTYLMLMGFGNAQSSDIFTILIKLSMMSGLATVITGQITLPKYNLKKENIT